MMDVSSRELIRFYQKFIGFSLHLGSMNPCVPRSEDEAARARGLWEVSWLAKKKHAKVTSEGGV